MHWLWGDKGALLSPSSLTISCRVPEAGLCWPGFIRGISAALAWAPNKFRTLMSKAMGRAGKEPKAHGVGVPFTAQYHPETAPSAAQKPLWVEPLPQSFYSQGSVAAQGLEWTRGAGKSLGCFCPTPRSASSTLDWALLPATHPSQGQSGQKQSLGCQGPVLAIASIQWFPLQCPSLLSTLSRPKGLTASRARRRGNQWISWKLGQLTPSYTQEAPRTVGRDGADFCV